MLEWATNLLSKVFILCFCFCGVGFHVAFDGSLPGKVAYRVMASSSGQLTFCLGYSFFAK